MDVCKLEDFKESFQRLDELIGIEIGSSVNNEIIDTDPLIVKAIGGFALLYHELRYSGVTADVDSVTDIPDVYIKLIKRVGNEMNIPEDWLNDHSKSDMANIESKWEAVDWNLKHIKIFVLNVKSLIIDKIGWAEKNLSGASITDKDHWKYEYKANFSAAVTILQDFLRENGEASAVIKQINRNLIPIRPGRTSKRNVKPQSFIPYNYRSV